MTEKNKRLAEKWVQSFIVSKGFLEPQGLWLEANLSEEEKQVTSQELINDPDSRPILIAAYRKVTKFHNFTDEGDHYIEYEIRKQINLARSQMIYGGLGYIND